MYWAELQPQQELRFLLQLSLTAPGLPCVRGTLPHAIVQGGIAVAPAKSRLLISVDIIQTQHVAASIALRREVSRISI